MTMFEGTGFKYVLKGKNMFYTILMPATVSRYFGAMYAKQLKCSGTFL